MLPVLSAFGGQPEASDEGQLLYFFPHLASASTNGTHPS